MYNASAQFHSAVFENSPVERVLFKFADGTIFTNEDIHIGSGLKLIEAVNLEEELTIGSCPAASLEATIMNYHGLLSGFAFGEAEVSLGVRTETVNVGVVAANAVAYMNGIKLCGYSVAPYLTLGGDATAAQPNFPVHAIVIDGLNVYCLGLEGQCWGATLDGAWAWDDVAAYTKDELDAMPITWDDMQGVLTGVGDISLSPFMTAKAASWAARGRGAWYNGGILYECFTDGAIDKYEYVKLGTFLLNTPTKRKVNLISVSALDRMARFDVAADDFWNGLTYPVTIGQIFTQLCAFVGVPVATTSFINSTRSFSEAPMVAEGITAREILGWIAEAACSFARMTRDGEVELAWFSTRPVTIPMTQYFSITPAEYEVAPIDKLQISGSATDIGVIIGEGENGYQILDNPLLYGETDTEIRTLGVPIFNRLAAYAAFSPIVASAVCDWSIQAGDIIEIVLNGVTYALPVYSQTIMWKGNARVAYESTGAEKRPVMAATNRRVYAQKRAIHEVSETVDGLMRHLEDVDGNIADLELTTGGLALAINANKLLFNANGLTVEGGGLRIKNNAGTDVFYADINGNLTLSGQLSAVSGTFNQILSTGSNPYIRFGSNLEITEDYLEIANIYLERNLVMIGDSVFTPDTIQINAGAVTKVQIDASGMWLPGAQDTTRFYMNPPTGSGTAAHWVYRSAEGIYSLGIYSSSRKYKDDIRDLDVDAMGILMRLTPSWFRYKTDDFNLMGLIAEPTCEACADLVTLRNGEPDSVRYESVTTLLVAAVQELNNRVKELESAR